MNKYLLAIAGASLLSFSAFSNAADEIKHSDMEKYTKIGDVSAEVRYGTMDDIVKKLEKKAEEKDADAYRITSVGTEGMGDIARGTAEIYKKK